VDEARVPVYNRPGEIKLLEGCWKSQGYYIWHSEGIKGHAVRLGRPIAAQPFAQILAKFLPGKLNLMSAGDQTCHLILSIFICQVGEVKSGDIYARLNLF
jgi:hypothetical protein